MALPFEESSLGDCFALFQAESHAKGDKSPRPAPGEAGSLGANDSASLTQAGDDWTAGQDLGHKAWHLPEPQSPHLQDGCIDAFTKGCYLGSEINAKASGKKSSSRKDLLILVIVLLL